MEVVVPYLDHINNSINAQEQDHILILWVKHQMINQMVTMVVNCLHSTGGNVEPTVFLIKLGQDIQSQTFGASDLGKVKVHIVSLDLL